MLLVVFIFISGNSFAEAQDKTSQCLQGLKKDARFSSIANHVVLDAQDVTKPQMLSDKISPNEQQKRAIADWIDARSQCVNLSPSKVPVDLHILFLSIVPDLYNGQITFGEFNQKWRTLFKEITEAPVKPQDKPVTHQH
ncbi:MAG: hypothetical protein PHG89_09715 [Gallionella sp.]|nr:hypothetical protein [Gallionella sp.]